METIDLRQKLHHYIDKGDSKLLNLMYVLAREYNSEYEIEYEFSEDDLKIFEERKEKRENGESQTLRWNEAKELIIAKRK